MAHGARRGMHAHAQRGTQGVHARKACTHAGVNAPPLVECLAYVAPPQPVRRLTQTPHRIRLRVPELKPRTPSAREPRIHHAPERPPAEQLDARLLFSLCGSGRGLFESSVERPKLDLHALDRTERVLLLTVARVDPLHALSLERGQPRLPLVVSLSQAAVKDGGVVHWRRGWCIRRRQAS